MTTEAKKVFDKFFKIHHDNVAGKTICFISRGEWSDPQIAYKGYLLNYWDVYELACPEDAPDDYEPDETEWYDACVGSLFGYTDCGLEPDKFEPSDAMSVTGFINIKKP